LKCCFCQSWCCWGWNIVGHGYRNGFLKQDSGFKIQDSRLKIQDSRIGGSQYVVDHGYRNGFLELEAGRLKDGEMRD